MQQQSLARAPSRATVTGEPHRSIAYPRSGPESAIVAPKTTASLGRSFDRSLTAFVVERSRHVGTADVGACAGVVRAFLTYARREHLIDRDLAGTVEHPRFYALATLPRSITREEVARFLAIIDRKSDVGRRDYAMLLLLATYGLRAREVAAMTLDDFDWSSVPPRASRSRGSASTSWCGASRSTSVTRALSHAGSAPTSFGTRPRSTCSRPESRST